MPVQERSASLRVPSRDGLKATLDRRSTRNYRLSITQRRESRLCVSLNKRGSSIWVMSQTHFWVCILRMSKNSPNSSPNAFGDFLCPAHIPVYENSPVALRPLPAFSLDVAFDKKFALSPCLGLGCLHQSAQTEIVCVSAHGKNYHDPYPLIFSYPH